MLIVLPNQRKGLPDLLKKLGEPGILARILASNFRKREVKLHLPRFKLEPGKPLDVKSIMMACGMNTLFGSSADLSRMCTDRKLWVDSVLHKAILEVSPADGFDDVPQFLIRCGSIINPIMLDNFHSDGSRY